MKNGFIKLHRKATDSSIFSHAGMWKLFCLCLMKATHESIEFSIPGVLHPIKLEPGQFITGRESIWEEYHQLHLKKRKPARKPTPTAYSLFRWLLAMRDMQILSIKTYNKYSIITVRNWNQYQQNVQQVSNRRASGEHKQEVIRNNKNILAGKIYDFYISEISPRQKSKQRALKNIEAHLKKHDAESLKDSIRNYEKTAKGYEPSYRKDPANFFGKREPAFPDYLPVNFQAVDTSEAAAGSKIREITPENIEAIYEN